MSVFKPGGPAFPLPDGVHEGMTLRDYFAAAALTGTLASGSGVSSADLAKSAYEDADAMLAERQKIPPGKVAR